MNKKASITPRQSVRQTRTLRNSLVTKRNSRTKSRIVNLETLELWHRKVQQASIYMNSYDCDVVLLIETNYNSCAQLDNLRMNNLNHREVKFITYTDLTEFLMDTVNMKNEAAYVTYFADQFRDIYTEYHETNKLSVNSLAVLIKIRIIAYNETIRNEQELRKKLKQNLLDELHKAETTKKSKDTSKPKGGRKASTKFESLGDKFKRSRKNLLYPKFEEKDPNFTIFNADIDIPELQNIYFVICNIYETELIPELKKYDIHLVSLIEMDVDENLIEKIDVEYFEIDKSEAIKSFWSYLTSNCSNLSEVLPETTCFLKFIVSDAYNKDTDKFFEYFLVTLKNITDFKRLYGTYFNNVRYLDVTEDITPVPVEKLNNYNAFLDRIPNECITIPLIMYALLDEICIRTNKCTNSQLDLETNKKKIRRNIHGGPTNQIKSLLNQYDYKTKKTCKILKMPKAIHVNYGNIIEYKNGHIPITKIINTLEITLNGLSNILPLKLFQIMRTNNTFDTMFFNYVFSKWSKHLENISEQELKQCVYSYLFTRGNFKKPLFPCKQRALSIYENILELMFGIKKMYNEEKRKPNVIIDNTMLCLTKNENPPETFNNFNEYCENLCPDYCTMAEELDRPSLIQILNQTYDTFEHFDYKYFGPTDVILIRFHYNIDYYGLGKQESDTSLRTPICFRDFCAKILPYDVEWFMEKEQQYWVQSYHDREFDNQSINKGGTTRTTLFNAKNFLIEGSFKFQTLLKPAKKSKTVRSSKEKTSSLPKLKRKSDKSEKLMFTETQTNNVNIPNYFANYDPSRTYFFEIYNLGPNYFYINEENIRFQSSDGLSIILKKQKICKLPNTFSFLISGNDNNFKMDFNYKNVLIPSKPLTCTMQAANGIIMVFTKPTNLPDIKQINKHILVDKILSKTKTPTDNKPMPYSNQNQFIKATRNSTLLSTEEIDYRVDELKNNVLEYLKVAIKEQVPVFKIIAGRLHKYQYVKRVKTQMQLPIGNLIKRVSCKPKLFRRISKKNQNIYESKVIPYSDMVNKRRTQMEWKCKASLPTGLCLETVQAVVPHNFYIKQKYIVERGDIPTIADESYRCFLRCGVIMKFLKDGSIKTLAPDKTIGHYKYGYFSSNRRFVSKDNIYKETKLKKATNIIPLHAYKKNLTQLQKKINKICNKYKTHLIDIADNYRFESSRFLCRKVHKIYELSKKIYLKDSHLMPLINYNIITATGRVVTVKNNTVHDLPNKYEEEFNKDYLLNETLLHRQDGTSWLIDGNGQCTTQFPDGSRITTWCQVLDEHFSVEEPNNNLIISDCHCDENPKLRRQYRRNPRNDETDFVLLGMNYIFEHPNYATVSYIYKRSKINKIAEITMPDNIKITAFKKGTFKVNYSQSDFIELNRKQINFEMSACDSCNAISKCSMDLNLFKKETFSKSDIFLSAMDSNFKEFKVNVYGTVVKSNMNLGSQASQEKQDPSTDSIASLQYRRMNSSETANQFQSTDSMSNVVSQLCNYLPQSFSQQDMTKEKLVNRLDYSSFHSNYLISQANQEMSKKPSSEHFSDNLELNLQETNKKLQQTEGGYLDHSIPIGYSNYNKESSDWASKVFQHFNLPKSTSSYSTQYLDYQQKPTENLKEISNNLDINQKIINSSKAPVISRSKILPSSVPVGSVIIPKEQLMVQQNYNQMHADSNPCKKHWYKKLPERLFVIKRDLSGFELHSGTIPYKFSHTLVDISNNSIIESSGNVVAGHYKTKIFKHLRKTYTENLMMLYELPILATTNEKTCIEKLFKIHDYDINTIISKREPLVIYERIISHLPSDLIMSEIAQAVLRCIIEGSENLPNIEIVRHLSHSEKIEIESQKEEPKISIAKFVPKRSTYKHNIAKYKELVSQHSIPKYFETLKGLMFLAVEECADFAMSASKGAPSKIDDIDNTTSQKTSYLPRKPSKTSNTYAPPVFQTKHSSSKRKTHDSKSLKLPSSSSKYPGKLPVPENLTIHLKPDSPVYDIILTSTGLKIITEKSAETYLFQDTIVEKQIEQPIIQVDIPETNKIIIEEKSIKSVKSKESMKSKKTVKSQESLLSKPSEKLKDIKSNEVVKSESGQTLFQTYQNIIKPTSSWNSDICEQICFNPSIGYVTLNARDDIFKNPEIECTPDKCQCIVPISLDIRKCCKCQKEFCNCADNYSVFATCSIQNELNVPEFVSVLAWKIVETFENDLQKFQMLLTRLDSIIKDTVNILRLPDTSSDDIIKSIVWIIKKKLKMETLMPIEAAVELLKEIETYFATLSVHPSNVDKDTVSAIVKIQEISETVEDLIQKSTDNKKTVKEIKKLFVQSKLNTNDIHNVLKLTKEKLIEYYKSEVIKDYPVLEIQPNSIYAKVLEYINNLLNAMCGTTCDICFKQTESPLEGKESIMTLIPEEVKHDTTPNSKSCICIPNEISIKQKENIKTSSKTSSIRKPQSTKPCMKEVSLVTINEPPVYKKTVGAFKAQLASNTQKKKIDKFLLNKTPNISNECLKNIRKTVSSTIFSIKSKDSSNKDIITIMAPDASHELNFGSSRASSPFSMQNNTLSSQKFRKK